MPMNCTFKMVKMVHFKLRTLYHNYEINYFKILNEASENSKLDYSYILVC